MSFDKYLDYKIEEHEKLRNIELSEDLEKRVKKCKNCNKKYGLFYCWLHNKMVLEYMKTKKEYYQELRDYYKDEYDLRKI